jgi:hypothetical protein
MSGSKQNKKYLLISLGSFFTAFIVFVLSIVLILLSFIPLYTCPQRTILVDKCLEEYSYMLLFQGILALGAFLGTSVAILVGIIYLVKYRSSIPKIAESRTN